MSSGKKRGLGRGLGALIPEKTYEDFQERTEKKSEEAIEKRDVSRETSKDNAQKDTVNSAESVAQASEKEQEDAQIKAGNKDSANASTPEESLSGLTTLPLDQIEADPLQPRKEFDQEAIQGLADSLASQGMLQPIVVHRVAKDRYRIVAGERRWRAAKLAGMVEVPVIIRELDPEDILQISLIENVQREDLNIIEEAEAYRRMADEFYYTHQEISRLVGKSRSHITNTLRLLQLPEEIREFLLDGSITSGHARALLPLLKVEDQLRVVEEIKRRHLNVRQTERLVERLLQSADQEEVREDPEEAKQEAQFLLAVQAVEDELSQYLGTKVRLWAGKKRGQIVIDYYDHEDLERIFDRIGMDPNADFAPEGPLNLKREREGDPDEERESEA